MNGWPQLYKGGAKFDVYLIRSDRYSTTNQVAERGPSATANSTLYFRSSLSDRRGPSRSRTEATSVSPV